MIAACREDPSPLEATTLLQKFNDPARTAKGEPRARVTLKALETLWVNTGTLCNITCRNCYIESSPRNDRLAYISASDVEAYLDEIARLELPTRLVGLTGGEPFMNPEIGQILEAILARGLSALVLTNAMKPMMHRRAHLLALKRRHGSRLRIRVSIDHYRAAEHDAERGPGSFAAALEGTRWLSENGLAPEIAGRLFTGEAPADVRDGFAQLFAAEGLPVDAHSATGLVLFPEMDGRDDVPEITEACWGILKKSPEEVMCATARMVVKRKGAGQPSVVACTLLPYSEAFELGTTLAEAARPVALNHPHCAKFCVLGGASCGS